jgi:hypothetical protein
MAHNELLSLGSWVLEARQLALSKSPDVGVAATANMLIFPIPRVVDVQEVHHALESVRSEYENKARDGGRSGFFYAWVDEMSGTIRCSFCDVATLRDLPFHCSLKMASSLGDIAACVEATYTHGIPSQELAEVEWSEPDDSAELELLIFAEHLVPPHGGSDRFRRRCVAERARPRADRHVRASPALGPR